MRINRIKYFCIILFSLLVTSSYSQKAIKSNVEFPSRVITSFESDEYCGVYQNQYNSRSKLTVYPAGEDTYLVIKTIDYDFGYPKEPGDDSIYRKLECMVREKDELMFNSASFEEYGKEDYYIRDGQQLFYFEWLVYVWAGGDSIDFVHKKIENLPLDWSISAEERSGEEGVIDERNRYLITKIVNVEKDLDSENGEEHWTFEFSDYGLKFRVPLSRMHIFPYLYSLCQMHNFDPSKLEEELVKITFPLDGGSMYNIFYGIEEWLPYNVPIHLRFDKVYGLKAK